MPAGYSREQPPVAPNQEHGTMLPSRRQILATSLSTFASLWWATRTQADAPKDIVRLGKEATNSAVPMSVVFSPNGKVVGWVTEARGKTVVHLWDVAQRKELRQCQTDARQGTVTLQASSGLVFSPDSKSVAVEIYEEIDKGPGKSNRFAYVVPRVWEVESGQLLGRIGERQADATALGWPMAFSSDGKALLSVTGGEVTRYELATGRQTAPFELTAATGVFAIALAREGTWLAAQWNENPVQIWDVAQGKKRHELKNVGAPLEISGNGKLLATNDPGVLNIWGVAEEKLISQVRIPALKESEHLSVRFSADGKSCAYSGSGKTISLCEVSTGKEIRRFEGEGSALALSPDGKTLAAGGKNGTILVWELEPSKK
jgi:WD40 repeat protein